MKGFYLFDAVSLALLTEQELNSTFFRESSGWVIFMIA